MRGSKFALSICLILSAAIGLSVLSSCGGGGGSRPVTKPGDEVIITPPGNRAPVVSQAFENVVLPPSPGRSRWESQTLSNYFSDPDGGTLKFGAQVDNSNVASAEISNTGSLVVDIQGSATATITVTAQDSDGLSVEQSFTVTVSDNTVTPPDHSDTLAGATDTSIGQIVEGHINSPEDVDYFRFHVGEPGTVTITFYSELAGVQVSLLDGDGNVLAVAETASDAELVIQLLKDGIYLVKVALSKTLKAALRTSLLGLIPSPFELLLHHPVAGSLEPPRVKRGELDGHCYCLTFIEPDGEVQEFNLADYIEVPTPLVFHKLSKVQDGLEGLTHKFDKATGRLTIKADRGADVGIHRYRVIVGGVASPSASLEFKVNVWAIPRILPGESLNFVAQAGKNTSINLNDVIGPPPHVGYTPKIVFDLYHDTPILRANVRQLKANVGRNPNAGSYGYLSVAPPSDLQGYYNLRLSAWFPDTEMSADFPFRVTVSGPRIKPGSPPLSVSLSLGGSGEIDLTNHIEDPLGGPLTFTQKSVPASFHVTISGTRWIIEAGEEMEPGEYEITLTATDSNDLSDDFSLELTVEGCQAQVVFNDHDIWTPPRAFTSAFLQSKYTGDCKNGRANGRGKFVATSGPGQSLSYDGQWQDGEPRGQGKWQFNMILSERRYEGEWQDRRPHGPGTGSIEYTDGDTERYSGEWVDGHPHGQGTYTALKDGDRYRYVGAFRDGLQHGRGVETNRYANGDRERLEGEFRYNEIWRGTATWNGVSCPVVDGEWNWGNC